MQTLFKNSTKQKEILEKKSVGIKEPIEGYVVEYEKDCSDVGEYTFSVCNYKKIKRGYKDLKCDYIDDFTVNLYERDCLDIFLSNIQTITKGNPYKIRSDVADSFLRHLNDNLD